jgi:hypothetical protein
LKKLTTITKRERMEYTLRAGNHYPKMPWCEKDHKRFPPFKFVVIRTTILNRGIEGIYIIHRPHIMRRSLSDSLEPACCFRQAYTFTANIRELHPKTSPGQIYTHFHAINNKLHVSWFDAYSKPFGIIKTAVQLEPVGWRWVVGDINGVLYLCESCSFSVDVLPSSFAALSDCLVPHNGFLFLSEPLYFLLDPHQFLFSVVKLRCAERLLDSS